MRTKAETRIQLQFCNEKLDPIQISSKKEEHFLAHQTLATFSRRSFCSKDLICGSSASVKRFVEGCNQACISSAGFLDNFISFNLYTK